MANQKIRTCPYCKQNITFNPGIKNWKNLFRKPTIEQGILFFVILCSILLAIGYRADIEECNRSILSISANCPKVVVADEGKINLTFECPNYNTEVNRSDLNIS